MARASRNKLLQVCNTVVRSIVLKLIADKIAHATDRRAQMLQSVNHHEEVLTAVRAGDGPRAASLARRTMYDYYAEYVTAEERHALRALLE